MRQQGLLCILLSNDCGGHCEPWRCLAKTQVPVFCGQQWFRWSSVHLITVIEWFFYARFLCAKNMLSFRVTNFVKGFLNHFTMGGCVTGISFCSTKLHTTFFFKLEDDLVGIIGVRTEKNNVCYITTDTRILHYLKHPKHRRKHRNFQLQKCSVFFSSDNHI